jgi:hypothetical protein
MKYAAFAALLLSVTALPKPVMAQFVTVQCSQNIRAVGRPAAIEKNAEQSAIDSWDSEARRIHGSSTAFTFRWGERLGRVQMSCSRRLGRVTCTTSGRSCVYVPTTARIREVPAHCKHLYVRDGSECLLSGLGDQEQDSSFANIAAPRIPRMSLQCPASYRLNGTNCVR